MTFLLLNEYGWGIKTRKNSLYIEEGTSKDDKTVYTIPASKIAFNRVIINGKSGYITYDAVKWLISKKISIIFLDEYGNLFTQMHAENKNLSSQILQFNASQVTKLKFAKDIILSKTLKQFQVIEWIERTLKKDFSQEKGKMEKYSKKIEEKTILHQIKSIEGFLAKIYWSVVKSVIPNEFGFNGRVKRQRGFTRPDNAKDRFNCLLNYSYSVLLSEITRNLYIVGFSPYLGFIHETKQGIPSFAYDVIEPYRFLVEKTLIKNIKLFKEKYFITDYEGVIRLRSKGIEILIPLLYDTFYSKVFYKNRQITWHTVFYTKLLELKKYLESDGNNFSFSKP
jgi:CRISPR-associated protein Cas1